MEILEIIVDLITVILIYLAAKDIYLDIRYDEVYCRTKYIILSLIVSINTILHGIMVVPIAAYLIIVFGFMRFDSIKKKEEEYYYDDDEYIDE